MKNKAYLTEKIIHYLSDLRDNNNRSWYFENKHRLENDVFPHIIDLVTEIGNHLSKIFPDIIADPRTDRSIYRLPYDVRYNKNKDPYKTHLALWLWDDLGDYGRVESPGFYVHFEADAWLWSVGCYRFSKEALVKYREALADKKAGEEFETIINSLKKENIVFNQAHLKRKVKGYVFKDSLEPWSRYKGLYSGDFMDLVPYTAALFNENAAEFIVNKFKSSFKLHSWFIKYLK